MIPEKELTRKFSSVNDMRKFVFTILDDNWDVDENPYYEERSHKILSRVHLGEGLNVYFRGDHESKYLHMEVVASEAMKNADTFERLFDLKAWFESAQMHEKNPGYIPPDPEAPKAESSNMSYKEPEHALEISSTGAGEDHVVFDDMYNTVDGQVGGSFHGC